MKKKIMISLRMALIFVAVLAALGITTLALAQSSAYFDLGCWGALTAGGGLRNSPTIKAQDATGQMAVGVTSSANVIVHSGQVHQFLTTTATRAAEAQPVTGANVTYLSAIFNFISHPRVCQ